MTQTLDVLVNTLSCESLEGLECLLQYQYKKILFLYRLIKSQFDLIEDITSDYDDDSSLYVKIEMSDKKAARKLLSIIDKNLESHDYGDITVITSIDSNYISITIEADEY
jgi:hypothetical protein